MKNKYLIFVLIVLSVSLMVISCGEKSTIKEQSILFYDDYLKNNVVSGLNREGIEYRIEGKSVWYLIDHKDEVKKIYEDALINRPIEYKFYDLEKQRRFVSLLESEGVNPLVKNEAGGVAYVYIRKKSRIAAEKVFEQIIKH